MKVFNALFAGILLFFMLFTSASAKQYAGKNIEDTLSYNGKTMQLNGFGLRKKSFISLYVGSLYLTTKSNDAEKIMVDDSSPMAIRLSIKSSFVNEEKMKAATLAGFEKSTGGNTGAIQPQIDALIATYNLGMEVGDVYDLVNMPGSGVHVLRNGEKITMIPSLAFKKALFGIWLSKQPIQQNLKRHMLGM